MMTPAKWFFVLALTVASLTECGGALRKLLAADAPKPAKAADAPTEPAGSPDAPAPQPAADAPAETKAAEEKPAEASPADDAALKAEIAAERAAVRASLRKAKLSLLDAVKKGLAKVPGSKAVETYFEAEGDELIFVVEVVTAGKHKTVVLDAVSGETLEVADEQPENKIELELEDSILKSKATLSAAIETALKKVPKSKAFDAHADKHHEKTVIDVELLDGKKIIEVFVDPTTGEVMDVEEAKD